MNKKKADIIARVKPLALATHPQKEDMTEFEWFKRLYKWSGLGTAEELCVDFTSLEIAELLFLWRALNNAQQERLAKVTAMKIEDDLRINQFGGNQNADTKEKE